MTVFWILTRYILIIIFSTMLEQVYLDQTSTKPGIKSVAREHNTENLLDARLDLVALLYPV